MGRKKYGHGVRATDNPQTWGTHKNSWLEMAQEEFLDGIVYVVTDFIRQVGVEKQGEDDNETIMFYVKNPELMDSEKHRKMVTTLLEYSELCG
jgi:hypothetical protein